MALRLEIWTAVISGALLYWVGLLGQVEAISAERAVAASLIAVSILSLQSITVVFGQTPAGLLDLHLGYIPPDPGRAALH